MNMQLNRINVASAPASRQTRILPAQRKGRNNNIVGKPARAQLIIVAALQIQTRGTTSQASVQSVQAAQSQILGFLSRVEGRGKSGLDEQQRAELEAAVEVLEANGGLADVTSTPGLLDGRWRLLFTSRPGTASPIQNTFTGVQAFSVFQDVDLAAETPTINNVVDFGPKVGYLEVQALASTDSRPLEGFTPRKGAGLPLFGKSFTYPASRLNSRVDFQFDNAAFHFNALPFTIPYPVPFRLLGDETKGWLDVTYVSPDTSFRLSRGNKGTLFILVREQQVKAQLEAAIQAQDDEAVLNLIQFMALDNPVKAPARSATTTGTWRLVWTQQAPDASTLQKIGTKQAEVFQILDAATGSLENRVLALGGLLKLQAKAECAAISDTRTEVLITEGGFSIGPLRIPISVPRGSNNPGFVDWLYLDEDLRITRGSKGSVFIHRRVAEEEAE